MLLSWPAADSQPRYMNALSLLLLLALTSPVIAGHFMRLLVRPLIAASEREQEAAPSHLNGNPFHDAGDAASQEHIVVVRRH